MKRTSNVRVPKFELRLSKSDKEFIIRQIDSVLSGSSWTTGNLCRAFEESFAEFTGAASAVAVTNGGAALICALEAAGVAEGSAVVCPTLTAPPTAHSILASGRSVVFADSCSDDFGLDPRDVERKLKRYGGAAGAIVCVHVGGWISPRVTELKRLSARFDVPLIEDCAHAHTSRLGDRHAGEFSGIGAFSFFLTKPLTCGEGGIVTVMNESLAERIRVLRNYGKTADGRHIDKGSNFKISEFNAAVGLWAAKNAQRLHDERKRLAEMYENHLSKTNGICVVNVPGCDNSYYKFVVTLDSSLDRDSIRHDMKQYYGVESPGGVYDTLCHEEPFFRQLSRSCVLNSTEDFPQAQEISRRQLCLPLYPGLRDDEQAIVVDALQKVVAQHLRGSVVRQSS
ncbi:MAG: DegT/DnrJ/EryC1/StrS family aminotransferase [Woeseiaceae bacterium]|nr:DegT/DnrJ/EryC1/StrS family aminotransferase [Woeseiaceae bacterium]